MNLVQTLLKEPLKEDVTEWYAIGRRITAATGMDITKELKSLHRLWGYGADLAVKKALDALLKKAGA